MSKPIAVCISDLHFNINTLSLASSALKSALRRAEYLGVPLVIAGDLHDTKSLVHGQVENRLIEILSQARARVFILVGNHDLLNEKSSENGLNYLSPYAEIINEASLLTSGILLLPYQSLASNYFAITQSFKTVAPIKTIICHQGFMGAQMGDYLQDKTSIDPELVKDFTVISGHYHRHQTLWSKIASFLKLPFGKGTITYIGSPYTITYGEANDGPKGFLVLNEDGSFTRGILNLRKHIILNRDLQTANDPVENYNQDDLVWLKITGSKIELDQLNKTELGLKLFGHSNFKLDLFPIEENNQKQLKVQNQQDWEILDSIIDTSSHDDFVKEQLKVLYKELNETT